MQPFETIATVETHGQIHVAGVPFEAGTEVAIVISPVGQDDDTATVRDEETLAASRARMKELFRTVQGFRNSPRIP
jgi:hypothetical protein